MLTFSDPNMRSQTVISSQKEVQYNKVPQVQGWEVSKTKSRNNEHFPLPARCNSSFKTHASSQSLSNEHGHRHKMQAPCLQHLGVLLAAILISKMIYGKESTPPRCKILRKNTNTSASCLRDINGTGKTSSQLQPCHETTWKSRLTMWQTQEDNPDLRKHCRGN